jgi:thiol-disulfide isomerase/thioredoxin
MKPMSDKLKKSLLTWIGLIALFIGLQFFVNRNLARGTPPPIVGTTLDGQAFAGLESLKKPAVIYFWASWCGVCKAMQDTVGALAGDTPMVTVALQSGDAAEVKAYMDKEGFRVPVVLDEDGAIGKRYGLRGVPAVFIVGPDDAIRFSTVGYTSELGLRLRLWLAGL